YPEKYFRHIEFIRGGSTGYRFYFEFAATAAGYWGLARRTAWYLVESLNWPLVLLGVAGVALAWRKRMATITLLLPVAATIVAVLLPVRYVEMRYLLVMDYIFVLFAACALARGLDAPAKPLRALSALLILVSVGWQVARGADLTWLMWNESRVRAAQWFAEQLKTPTVVEYFGDYTDPASTFRRLVFLPKLPPGSSWRAVEAGSPPGSRAPMAQYVLVMGTEDLEKHWYCTERSYRGLADGSHGYRRVAEFETKSLFAHPGLKMNPNVNPPIEIYQREAARLPLQVEAEKRL
ncbi:MAG TPA: hypothetical protein VNL38_04305, partial [Candidatus Nitrosotenuis sp.]|nr:hypothetical protein [Candidatus Nitrosotenuis sp.]